LWPVLAQAETARTAARARESFFIGSQSVTVHPVNHTNQAKINTLLTHPNI
jgi:hypothetical protein